MIAVKNEKPTTILDVSKGLGYGFLYHPVIGSQTAPHYPFAIRFPSLRRRRSRVRDIL